MHLYRWNNFPRRITCWVSSSIVLRTHGGETLQPREHRAHLSDTSTFLSQVFPFYFSDFFQLFHLVSAREGFRATDLYARHTGTRRNRRTSIVDNSALFFSTVQGENRAITWTLSWSLFATMHLRFMGQDMGQRPSIFFLFFLKTISQRFPLVRFLIRITDEREEKKKLKAKRGGENEEIEVNYLSLRWRSIIARGNSDDKQCSLKKSTSSFVYLGLFCFFFAFITSLLI